jgi:hypothetical protein
MDPRRPLSVALLATVAFFSPAASADVTLLTEGAVLEREMKAGEVHRYSIELREGEYLQAVPHSEVWIKSRIPLDWIEKTLLDPGEAPASTSAPAARGSRSSRAAGCTGRTRSS